MGTKKMRSFLYMIVAAAVAALFKQLLNNIKLITRKNYGTGKIGKIVIYFGFITLLTYSQTILRFKQFNPVFFSSIQSLNGIQRSLVFYLLTALYCAIHTPFNVLQFM